MQFKRKNAFTNHYDFVHSPHYMELKEAKTLKDLAKITGFTESTISRTLNGIGTKYRISKDTQKKIIEAANEANFSFNENARGLRLRKTMTVGFIVPDISNSFFAKMASLVEREARLHKYAVFLCDSDNSTEVEQASITLLQKRKVDGIIVCPIGLESEHLVKLYKETPLVLVDRYFPKIDIPFVTSNDVLDSYKVVQHLISKGHKKIACIQGVEHTSQNDMRIEGYKKALEDNDIAFDPKLLIGNSFSEENGYNAAQQIIGMPKTKRPTAIFSLSSIITLGALKSFTEAGLKIPEDFSIVSFDEQEYSALLATPLTTIGQPKEEMGTKAFQMLLAQMDSEKEENLKQKGLLLPTQLNFRDSIKAP
ncbi:LacI family DNA-binding transcriptional regulator [Maribacter sp. 2210JD10-5]|uniref:LacI family DNA-binding transcriptional regulator n=1 Tax=Maribacter sp. 2210JD10-5 TaxID=3386272 RepID=UPI0039BC9DE8